MHVGIKFVMVMGGRTRIPVLKTVVVMVPAPLKTPLFVVTTVAMEQKTVLPAL